MRSHLVVMSSPNFDDDLGFEERIKYFSIQKQVTHFAVE